MKKNPAVAAAEQAKEAVAKELEEARALVRRLESDHGVAIRAVREAQEMADADLPQCRIAQMRSGVEKNQEEARHRVVIVRRTPTGMLVVRSVGDTSGYEYKFKWSGRAYVQAEKARGFSFYYNELRDVPAEYMPATATS